MRPALALLVLSACRPDPACGLQLGTNRDADRDPVAFLATYNGPSFSELGDLEVDLSTMNVSRGGSPLSLTPTGFRILTTLMQASPAVVTRRELERKVWGDILPDSDTLRSHMYNLRKSVDKPFSSRLLKTVQASGYQLIASIENG